jgi:predicted small secreted protein
MPYSRTALLCLPAAIAAVLAGCGNTLSGAKQDVARDTEGIRNSATQTAAKVKESTAAIAAKAKDSASTVAAKAKDSTEAVVRKTKAAGEEIKRVPENAGAAVVITPEIKTAIIRDPVLDDPRNSIDVSSHDMSVHLSGHVLSDLMKRRAGEDAQTVLGKRHPDYKVVNELAVRDSG